MLSSAHGLKKCGIVIYEKLFLDLYWGETAIISMLAYMSGVQRELGGGVCLISIN